MAGLTTGRDQEQRRPEATLIAGLRKFQSWVKLDCRQAWYIASQQVGTLSKGQPRVLVAR